MDSHETLTKSTDVYNVLFDTNRANFYMKYLSCGKILSSRFIGCKFLSKAFRRPLRSFEMSSLALNLNMKKKTRDVLKLKKTTIIQLIFTVLQMLAVTCSL